MISRLKTEIKEADAIVIGAGAGLSTSAGLTYSGKRFEKYFYDFAKRFGMAVFPADYLCCEDGKSGKNLFMDFSQEYLMAHPESLAAVGLNIRYLF